MKLLIAAGALALGLAGMQAPAFAQGTKAPVYKYCLQEMGGFRGGSGQILCRYNTLAQCWASKTSPGDLCYINTDYYRQK
jgi:hypothetical protein